MRKIATYQKLQHIYQHIILHQFTRLKQLILSINLNKNICGRCLFDIQTPGLRLEFVYCIINEQECFIPDKRGDSRVFYT